jgi:hypothetical protein
LYEHDEHDDELVVIHVVDDEVDDERLFAENI